MPLFTTRKLKSELDIAAVVSFTILCKTFSSIYFEIGLEKVSGFSNFFFCFYHQFTALPFLYLVSVAILISVLRVKNCFGLYP